MSPEYNGSVAAEFLKVGDAGNESLARQAEAVAIVALAVVLAKEATTSPIDTRDTLPAPIQAGQTPMGTEGYCWDTDENMVSDEMVQDWQNDS